MAFAQDEGFLGLGRFEGLEHPYRCRGCPGCPPGRSIACHALPTAVAASSETSPVTYDAVIVGAGPAGMATALALQRAGWRKLLLLERRTREECMQGGTALGLWTNAFCALDALGVGQAVRLQSSRTTKVEICRESNDKILTTFDLTACAGGPHEFGGVLRGALVEALYDGLDVENGLEIRFGATCTSCTSISADAAVSTANTSNASNTSNTSNRDMVVTTADGQVMHTSLVIGADGVNSVVARAYGAGIGKDMSTNDAGQIAIRGIAEGKPVDDQPIRQVLGAGVRAGMYPVGQGTNELYWYVCYPSEKHEKDSGILDEARRVLLESSGDWSTSCILDAIGRTSEARVSRNALADRWDIDALLGSGSQGNHMTIALTGDALHPMTPNLGQGGCCALEDAVLLAAYLPGPSASATELRQAIAEYTQKRAKRCVKLTVRARAMGEILQSGLWPVVVARDWFIANLFQVGGFLDHAGYDVRDEKR